MELDYNITLKHVSLMKKTMNEAQVLSPYAATLTWINDQLGSTVRQGDQLAVISDLKNFKISANI